MKNISYNKIQLSPAATCLFNAYGAMGLMPMGKPIVGRSKSLLAVMSGRDYNGKRMSPVVVDLTQKVNDKIEEVKTKVLDSSVDDDYLEAFENEIENVEEKLDEMIEEIKD